MLSINNIISVNSLEKLFTILYSSSSEFITESNYFNIKEENREVYWYRGHEDFNWYLQPSLFRNVLDNNEGIGYKEFWQKIRNLEDRSKKEFFIRNYHLLNIEDIPNSQDSFNICPIMQHQGLSTRFLDWSEHAITALFFSLSRYFKVQKDRKRTVPCVWVLKPKRLQNWAISEYNKIYKHKITDLPQIINSEDSRDNEKISRFLDCIPSSIVVPYKSERIQAQSGVFTIFPKNNKWGKEEDPKNLCLENINNADDFLFKIIISAPKHISNQLKMIGCKRSDFFPEVPVISSELDADLFRDIQI